jgi:hypothetical protein
MILGPITLIDCAVFVFFLIPQLFYQAGLGTTLLTVVKVLPFLSMPHLATVVMLRGFEADTILQSSNYPINSSKSDVLQQNGTNHLLSSVPPSFKTSSFAA